jgi:hypothetical protein
VVHVELGVDLQVGRAQIGKGADLDDVAIFQSADSIGRPGFAVQPSGNEVKRSEADASDSCRVAAD